MKWRLPCRFQKNDSNPSVRYAGFFCLFSFFFFSKKIKIKENKRRKKERRKRSRVGLKLMSYRTLYIFMWIQQMLNFRALIKEISCRPWEAPWSKKGHWGIVISCLLLCLTYSIFPKLVTSSNHNRKQKSTATPYRSYPLVLNGWIFHISINYFQWLTR